MNVPTETITLTMGDDNYNYNSRCLLGSLAVNKKKKKTNYRVQRTKLGILSSEA